MDEAVNTLSGLDWKLYLSIFLVVSHMYSFVTRTFVMPRNAPAAPVISKGSSAVEKITAYVFQGSGVSVSSSPFSTKLTMFCRLAGIPHVVKEADMQRAPNGKVPYIVHDGNCVGDSQLIIRYMENTFNIKNTAKSVIDKNTYSGLLKHPYVCYDNLNPKDQAICNMVRLMCEGELYWGMCGMRWLGKLGMGKSETLWHNTIASYFEAIPAFIRPVIVAMVRVSVHNDAYAQGLARHAPEDQMLFIKRDIKSLSSLLDKKFLVNVTVLHLVS